MTDALTKIIKWHLYRPWTGGDPNQSDDPRCGDCGTKRSEHPYPLAHVHSLGEQREVGEAIVSMFDLSWTDEVTP